MERDESGLPFWMHGKHPIWAKCLMCGCFCDPAVYENYMCRRCREPPSKDMECAECGKYFTREEMHNNFICKECYEKAIS